jgi:hypothetical protein
MNPRQDNYSPADPAIIPYGYRPHTIGMLSPHGYTVILHTVIAGINHAVSSHHYIITNCHTGANQRVNTYAGIISQRNIAAELCAFFNIDIIAAIIKNQLSAKSPDTFAAKAETRIRQRHPLTDQIIYNLPYVALD